MIEIADDERRAITALKRVAKKWPKTLWLFSASSTLNVMKKDADGKRGTYPDHASDLDPSYSVATIDIENDGGDW